MNLPFLSSLVSGPAFLRRSDVLLLPLLRAATYENDKTVAVLAEINAVTWPEVDLVFVNSRAYALCVRKISLLHPRERDGQLGGCRRVEFFQPVREPSLSFFIDVAAKLDHPRLW